MNNLHRELAPISEAAWADLEEETTRTLKRHLAGRRVVDVQGAGGVGLSAVGTGHLKTIAAPGEGILARQRDVKALVEFRVPFELDRQQSTTSNAVQTILIGNLQRTPRRRSPLPRTELFSRATRRRASSASAREPAIRA
jgi:Encapsulating protein for peroxidase